MAILATSDGTSTGTPVNDCYGSKTAAADTAFLRVVPPRSGTRAAVSGFLYANGATAHTLTFITVLSEVKVASEAASGQAVVVVDSVPTAEDGSLLAANDFVIVQHQDGEWEQYKVSSLSGKSVTLTANLDDKVLKGSRFFFMGAPGDHTERQVTVNASQVLSFVGGDSRLRAATAKKDDQPILVHSNNVTAAGILQLLAFTYGSA